MKTEIKLTKSNKVTAEINREKFLKVLEVLEEEDKELKKIRDHAKEAEEIVWFVGSKVVHFKYEEQRESATCTVCVCADEKGIWVLEAFLMSKLMEE